LRQILFLQLLGRWQRTGGSNPSKTYCGLPGNTARRSEHRVRRKDRTAVGPHQSPVLRFRHRKLRRPPTKPSLARFHMSSMRVLCSFQIGSSSWERKDYRVAKAVRQESCHVVRFSGVGNLVTKGAGRRGRRSGNAGRGTAGNKHTAKASEGGRKDRNCGPMRAAPSLFTCRFYCRATAKLRIS